VECGRHCFFKACLGRFDEAVATSKRELGTTPDGPGYMTWQEAAPPAEERWGDTEIAERGRSVPVMRARYRSAGLIPHQRGWTDAG